MIWPPRRSISAGTHHGEDLVVRQPCSRAYLERLERVDPLNHPHLALLPVQHVLFWALLPPRSNVVLLARRRRHLVVAGGELDFAAGHVGVLVFDAFPEFSIGKPCPHQIPVIEICRIEVKSYGQLFREKNEHQDCLVALALETVIDVVWMRVC